MVRNRSCAAATGHQRIMAVEDQADPASAAGETWSQGVLRDVQAYDFESGLCIFNGVHSLANFLPVVPGPCGLFRSSATTDDLVSQVREICSTPASADGLVQANLKIAEDRIMSYLLVLATTTDAATGEDRTWETHWVPSTVFYFEAETTLKEFVMQRRRWLNGTTAGYAWLLQQPLLWDAMARGRRLAWSVFLLSCLQLLVFAVVFLLPGVLAVTGYLSFAALLVILQGLQLTTALPSVLVDALGYLPGAYFAATFATFFAHVGLARLGRTPYTQWVWRARVVLNAAFMGVNLLVAATLLALSLAAPRVLAFDNCMVRLVLLAT